MFSSVLISAFLYLPPNLCRSPLRDPAKLRPAHWLVTPLYCGADISYLFTCVFIQQAILDAFCLWIYPQSPSVSPR